MDYQDNLNWPWARLATILFLVAIPANAQLGEDETGDGAEAEKQIQRAELLSARQGAVAGTTGIEPAGLFGVQSAAAAVGGTRAIGGGTYYTLEAGGAESEPASEGAAVEPGPEQWVASKRKIYARYPRLKVGIAATAGYDSNPNALHNAEGAAFAQIGVRATWDIDRGPVYVGPHDPDLHYERVLNLTYEGGARLYEGRLQDSNAIQQTFNVSYKHRVADSMLLYLHAGNVWTHIGQDPFLNTISALPAARYYWADWLATEIGYSYSKFEYLFDLKDLPVPNPSMLDPDADLHQIGPTLLLFAVRPELVGDPQRRGPFVFPYVERVGLGYAHMWNDADGADLEFEGDRLSLSISGLRFWATEGAWIDVALSQEWHDYANPSILSPTGEVRDDDVTKLAVAFNFGIEPLYDEASGRMGLVKLNVELVDNESNIQVRDFDQYVVSLAFTYQF